MTSFSDAMEAGLSISEEELTMEALDARCVERRIAHYKARVSWAWAFGCACGLVVSGAIVLALLIGRSW